MPSQSWTFDPWLIGLIAWIGLFLSGMPCGAQSYPSAQVQRIPLYEVNPSEKEGIRASIKRGFQGLAEALKRKTLVKSAEDPVKLSTKSRPTANFHVAAARLYEQSNQPALAADQYERALQLSPDDLAALLGYARLKDRLITPNEAASLYNRAVAAHPDEPAVFNNLGLFYAGRKMLDNSVAAFGHAIQLAPKTPKYRNNLARVLVAQGRNAEAFRELLAVHSQAVAYYNLGYLLEQRGKPKSAAHHYAMALRYDPEFARAQHALSRVKYSLADIPPLGETSRPASRSSDDPVGTALTHSRPAPPRLGAGGEAVHTVAYNEVEQPEALEREASRTSFLSLRRLPSPRKPGRPSPSPSAPMPPEKPCFGRKPATAPSATPVSLPPMPDAQPLTGRARFPTTPRSGTASAAGG